MNNTELLMGKLIKHVDDYRMGRTQDYEQVFNDCFAAADLLRLNIAEANRTKIDLAVGVQKESRNTKLCEIKVNRKDSLQELCYHLTANGYTVQTAVVWKEFPNSCIDYWMIAIFDKEEK